MNRFSHNFPLGGFLHIPLQQLPGRMLEQSTDVLRQHSNSCVPKNAFTQQNVICKQSSTKQPLFFHQPSQEEKKGKGKEKDLFAPYKNGLSFSFKVVNPRFSLHALHCLVLQRGCPGVASKKYLCRTVCVTLEAHGFIGEWQFLTWKSLQAGGE